LLFLVFLFPRFHLASERGPPTSPSVPTSPPASVTTVLLSPRRAVPPLPFLAAPPLPHAVFAITPNSARGCGARSAAAPYPFGVSSGFHRQHSFLMNFLAVAPNSRSRLPALDLG
ncbi:unnamed protein product, partial [Urochloa humidicola]